MDALASRPPQTRAQTCAKPLGTRPHSWRSSPVSAFFLLTILGRGAVGNAQCQGPQGTSLNGLWGDREEMGSERPADQNWLSQCVFTLAWAYSRSISPSPGPGPRQLPPLSPRTQAWPGLVGASPSHRPWDRPRSQGWLPGSLTSSVITSFTLSSKNPTQSRQTGCR